MVDKRSNNGHHLFTLVFLSGRQVTELPDDNSVREPPEPIPNSEVKPHSADGSVGFPHVRVGHCQALIQKTSLVKSEVFF